MTDDNTYTPKTTRKPRRRSVDQEAAAIAQCWKALEPLQPLARARVLMYVGDSGEAKTE